MSRNALTIAMLASMTATLLVGFAEPAQGQAVRPIYTNPFTRAVSGVWQGTLDFTNLGSDRIEPLTMSLSQTGVAILISEHEPTEIESATLGIWENAGAGDVEVGIQAHRLGEGACAIIVPPEGSAFDDCILKIYANLHLDGNGQLVGEVTLIFQEVDATTGNVVEVVPPALTAEFWRLDMDDFRR